MKKLREPKVREKKPRKKRFKMSEITEVVTPESLLTKDIKEGGCLEIRGENGAAGKLEIYFRHPVLADVVKKMSLGNYPKDQFDKVYAPILLEHPDPKAKAQGRVVSRPAIYSSTKNIVAGTDFDFTQPPRGVLISNHEALLQGFSIFIELKTPVPYDTLKKWGNMLKDGCSEIIAASRPFTMSWVFTESHPGKL